MAQLPGMPGWGEGWLASYLTRAGTGDVLQGDLRRGARWWRTLFDGIAEITNGHLGRLQDRIGRQVSEIGTAFRLPGESEERRWPVSGVPLLIGEDEWAGIEAGICQRAELLERLVADLYGPQTLVSRGLIPGSLVTGSPHFWRRMVGVAPPGGRWLHIYAADIARGPDGDWRVLADHVRSPTGAGYALENRLAATRVMGTLQTRLNVQRLAGFFQAFREGLAASCRRSDPRIGLLTPGRYNQSYAEQAHLARYLGLLLVEGADLAVRDGQLYVRTIEGLKRIDALWRRMDARFLDPLAFDNRSAIGVPGLMDAMDNGVAVIANAPGVGIVESAAFSAFLPMLARRLLGEPLSLPNIATWWAGQPRERGHVEQELDRLLIGPAFGAAVAGLDGIEPVLGAGLAGAGRARLKEAMALRPQDYVGQEVVRLSTMPSAVDGTLVPRPFSLRVFAARDANGHWTVMPGGFARLSDAADVRAAVMGDGAFSADVCIVGGEPSEAITLMSPHVAIRRNPGTLPSRAADNLYWLGRYLERGEGTLRLIRAALGGSIDVDGGAALSALTLDRLAGLLVSSGAAKLDDEDDEEEGGSIHDVPELAHAAYDGAGAASVRSLLTSVRTIGEGIRERLSADVWRLLDQPLPPLAGLDPATILGRATDLQERFSALAGLASENMARNAGWRFHDIGRRIERAVLMCRLMRHFARDDASADDLTALLDLADSQISYRARYVAGIALVPVRDLVALDPSNPRSLAYQIERIGLHLAALPSLRQDGMAEDQHRRAQELAAVLMTAEAPSLGPDAVLSIENRLLGLSEAIGRRFFLQSGETLRASGMVLA
ncbi:circularly permuted type 2 ATP-grasp protein [Sphingomonas sp. 1P06PA]|uniref:circularly permuted type 2 ATP-grasp protein n=1 Tax=Sphingomonas sp. 1P06PA TaxID=554121 RepID=UPI0039A67252